MRTIRLKVPLTQDCDVEEVITKALAKRGIEVIKMRHTYVETVDGIAFFPDRLLLAGLLETVGLGWKIDEYAGWYMLKFRRWELDEYEERSLVK